jgi:hypothetical protein
MRSLEFVYEGWLVSETENLPGECGSSSSPGNLMFSCVCRSSQGDNDSQELC